MAVELNLAVGLAVRWVHLAAGLFVVGTFAAVLLAGVSERATARTWEATVVRRARWLLLVALASGLGVLAHQTALVEGRPAAALELDALRRLLLETQAGHVWLARHGLLLLLGAFLLGGGDSSRREDWLAGRGEAVLLASAALVLLGASGHAAAVEPSTARAVAVDGLHLLAAGIWVGALPPLAGLLRVASDPVGADARPDAVLAARRFSWLALLAVGILLTTGVGNAVTHVGSVAGLLGTPYGRLLVLKLGLLAGMLTLAVLNRRRWLPALGGPAETVGRPAMRRLAMSVSVEAAFGLLILAVVAAMGITPPALHEPPTWPLSFRLSTVALEGAPELRWRALVGSQIAVLALVATVAALMPRSRRLPLLGGAIVLLGVGLRLLLPALAIDAYPTTYHRPSVPYHATSIAHGGRLYAEHCASCHGPAGAGDGAAGRGLPRPPADLRASHTGQHTAGDLFWWISRGIPRGGMPGFAAQLGEEERWDVVNYVRGLGAGAAPGPGPTVESNRPRLVAPDFSFAVGPMPTRSLRDYRGQRVVLLVFYTLPGSRPRLAQLARTPVLGPLGVEIIAVPRDAAPDPIRQLGDDPPIVFPVVTEGAREIVTAYELFARGAHAEFLIDRQGYIRALWATIGETSRDVTRLLGDIEQLNAEKPVVPAADEHVH